MCFIYICKKWPQVHGKKMEKVDSALPGSLQWVFPCAERSGKQCKLWGTNSPTVYVYLVLSDVFAVLFSSYKYVPWAY